jgi:carbonic anhydrase/acetyltransferase-like protein (isoleucine patch superfamily)
MPNLLPATIILFVWLGSVMFGTLPILLAEGASLPIRLLAIALFLPIFALSFLLLSGLASRPAQKKIIRGRFPRQPFHPVYFWRRIYGCCWTLVYYFKPLYFVFLTIPLLKKALLRLFGYKGTLNFVIYPDTWVRDLPLLSFGEGAYCSNRSTIGSNMCLQDGTILVDRVSMGAKSILGHLSMIAPGVRLEDNVELGVGVALGVRCRMKKSVRIGSGSSLNHGTLFGERSEIGGHSHVGLRAEIGDDLKIPAGANIPAGAIIRTYDDVEKYFSSENQFLQRHVADLGEKLKKSFEEFGHK